MSRSMLGITLWLLCCGAGAAAPQEKAVPLLNGEWVMDAEYGGGQHRVFTLRLEQRGEEVSGAIVGGAGEMPVERGRFSANRLSFQVNYQDAVYELKATLKDAALEGTWTSASSSGKWRAQKKGTPSSPADPSGVWRCRVTSGEIADREFTLTLKQAGSEITGTASSARGEAPIAKGSVKDNALEITIATGDGDYRLTGTLEQGRVTGRWRRWDNREGAWEGTKQ